LTCTWARATRFRRLLCTEAQDGAAAYNQLVRCAHHVIPDVHILFCMHSCAHLLNACHCNASDVTKYETRCQSVHSQVRSSYAVRTATQRGQFQIGQVSSISDRGLALSVVNRDKMSSVADTFGSHHEVMDALHQNFAGNDDAQRAIKVDKLRDDMAAACRLREDDIRTTISGQSVASCSTILSSMMSQ